MFSSCCEKLYLKTTPLSCTEISSSLLPILCAALTLSLSRKTKSSHLVERLFRARFWRGKRCFNMPFFPSSCEGTWTNKPICQSPGVTQKSCWRQQLMLIDFYLSQCQREQLLLQTQHCHLWPQLWQPQFLPLAEIAVTEERWAQTVGSWP